MIKYECCLATDMSYLEDSSLLGYDAMWMGLSVLKMR